MSLNDFKPLGAFIENTIRPILNELKDTGIELKIEDIKSIISKLAITHVLATIINAIRDIVVIGVIVFFIWKTYQS